MPFAAVLDASVLYPLPLRDTLLRVAEIELYDAYWSQRILDEVARNLIADARASYGRLLSAAFRPKKKRKPARRVKKTRPPARATISTQR